MNNPGGGAKACTYGCKKYIVTASSDDTYMNEGKPYSAAIDISGTEFANNCNLSYDKVYLMIGFGNCKKVCPFEAIEIVDGIARIDPNRCKACGKCVVGLPGHSSPLLLDIRSLVLLPLQWRQLIRNT